MLFFLQLISSCFALNFSKFIYNLPKQRIKYDITKHRMEYNIPKHINEEICDLMLASKDEEALSRIDEIVSQN